jgi:hypothetical protein
VIPYVTGPLPDLRGRHERAIGPAAPARVRRPRLQPRGDCILLLNAACPRIDARVTYFTHFLDIEGLGDRTAVNVELGL